MAQDKRTGAIINRLLNDATITAQLANTTLTGTPKAIYDLQIIDGQEGNLPAITVQRINGGIYNTILSSPEYYVSVHARNQGDAINIMDDIEASFDKQAFTYSGTTYFTNTEVGNMIVFEDLIRFNCVVRIKQQKGE